MRTTISISGERTTPGPQRDREQQRSLRFESLKLEVFKQNVLTLVRIHQGPKEYNFLFNEIHYVHAWQNRFAERFKLPTVVDQHAARDYSSNEQLAALIQAEVQNTNTVSVQTTIGHSLTATRIART